MQESEKELPADRNEEARQSWSETATGTGETERDQEKTRGERPRARETPAETKRHRD